MFKTHTTEDGEILIAQMTDDHLINTIKLHCRKICQYRALAENGITSNVFLKVLAGVNDAAARKEAESQIRVRHALLTEYVIEAALRGLSVAPYLQTAYGRSEVMPVLAAQSMARLLQGGDDDDDDDNEEDTAYWEHVDRDSPWNGFC